MEMKNKGFVLIAAILIFAALFGASFADYSGVPSIYISLAKYEPFPAEAGQFVEVWFKAENLGSSTADSVTLDLLPEFPFSLESDGATKLLGPVASGNSQLVKYRVKINEKATSGDNILQLRYKPSSAASWVTKDIDIFIQAHDAVLAVSGISSSEMAPGKTQAIYFSLENMADAYLKDVALSLDFSGTTLPFASLNSVNEKRILSIPAKGIENISFDIITSPDAAPGVYKVPLALKYSDITNKTYTRNYLLGFVVNSAPEFEIAVQKYDIITEGASGTVTVSVSDTGPAAIKFMTMDILPSGSYEILGENSIYLGNMNPDDYQTGVFKIYANKGAVAGGKTIPLKIALKYRDGLNNIYEKNATLNLRIYSPAEISIYGLGAAGGGNTALYAIIAVVAAYLIYRKYFKKKAKI